MTKVLVLGAGFVARPLVDYLAPRVGDITVASQFLAESEELAKHWSNISALEFNVNDETTLGELVKKHDLVVSLIPYQFHVQVAKQCILHRRHLVTASYESPEMRALNDAAKEAGITILNEIGLDPGIDHLTAMKTIHQEEEKGNSLESFVSWCGGLPSPEANDNPLGYKFAWSPKAVLLALLNEAQYLVGGQVKRVSSADLLGDLKTIKVSETMTLEGYPNRNSVHYRDAYQISSCQNLLRGTLRYPGFSAILQAVKQMGLLAQEADPKLAEGAEPITWRQYLASNGHGEPEARTKLGCTDDAIHGLTWLGLFSNEPVPQKGSAIDALCELLTAKLAYQKEENDMVVLTHKFVFNTPSNDKHCVQSTFIEIGDYKKYSAMAKTVGYPAAIAANCILQGSINEHGVLLPFKPAIYQPILAGLEDEGFEFHEHDIDIAPEDFLTEIYS